MKIRFILVEPKVLENIGASARAIKTMEFDSLVLIKPCKFPDGKAKWVANESGEILNNALVFDSLAESVMDSDYVIATSVKPRSVRQDYVPASELSSLLMQKSQSINICSLVFGREESVLTNVEMKLCDITSNIAMATTYSSLNLSQAVMIYAYELSGLSDSSLKDGNFQSNGNSIRALKVKLNAVLNSLGINNDENRYGRIMERVSFLKDDDINLVHKLCSKYNEKYCNIK